MFFSSKLGFLDLYLLFWQFGLAGNLIMKIQISLTILPKCLSWQDDVKLLRKRNYQNIQNSPHEVFLHRSLKVIIRWPLWQCNFDQRLISALCQTSQISDAHGVGICRVSRDDGNADLFSFLTHLGYITRLKSIRQGWPPEDGLTWGATD